MSAELNPKTSPGGQWDPKHQDALPAGTQTHLCTTLALSKALCRTSGDRDQQARLLPAQCSPAQSTAATKTLLLCQTPREGWLPCCSTGTPRQGTESPALGLQLPFYHLAWWGGTRGQRGWQSSTAPPPSAQNGSGTIDRHACQVFPIKVNNTRSLPGKDRSMEGILFV